MKLCGHRQELDGLDAGIAICLFSRWRWRRRCRPSSALLGVFAGFARPGCVILPGRVRPGVFI